MRTLNQFVIAVFSISLFLVSACESGNQKEAQDTQEETTQKVVQPEVIFENDYSRVVKVSLAPGEELASHEGEARLIYSLSDYSIDWEEKNQNLGTKSWKKGAVHFHEAGQHSAKNNGSSQAEWLAFSRKSTELPDCSDNSLENDVNAVASDFASLLFDNDNFRLTEVALPQGEKIPMHSGINRLIYSLTDYQILYDSNKEGKAEKTFKTGEAHWHEACQHALENTGQGEARFLVVAYKPSAQ
jgi:quercetin dioxygenase-like cupin family protein